MFRIVSILLSAMLCLPAAGIAKTDPRTAALAMPNGALVWVQIANRQTVEGRLAGITEDGITLQVAVNKQVTERTVLFSDMKSIRHINKPMSPATAVVIALGTLFGISAIISLAIGNR